MDLRKRHCVPCEGGTPPLLGEKEAELIKQVQDWILVRDPTTTSGQVAVHKITRQFKFENFKEALVFVNKVGELAESEGHHPDIKIVYNKVALDLFTHAVGGLSENDFIMAAKINAL